MKKLKGKQNLFFLLEEIFLADMSEFCMCVIETVVL